MASPAGLRRERLHCYDLELPADFTPIPMDGEVESFALLPIAELRRIVAHTDDVADDVNLVLIDLFQRLGPPPSGW